MTPAERQALERTQISMLNVIRDAAKVYGTVEALLNEDQTVDDRPKPGPPR